MLLAGSCPSRPRVTTAEPQAQPLRAELQVPPVPIAAEPVRQVPLERGAALEAAEAGLPVAAGREQRVAKPQRSPPRVRG